MGADGAGNQAGAGGVAAAAGQGAAVVDYTWVQPFKCHWEGCGQYLEKGASVTYVNSHMKNHSEDRIKQQAMEAARKAARAQQTLAAGPSSQRRRNRAKDMNDGQRAGAPGKNSKGKHGFGKGKRGGNKAAK